MTQQCYVAAVFVCIECGASFEAQGFCGRCGSALADGAADPLLGSSVGSYRVAGLIGQGGMGRVYKGVNPAIGSRVAIKVLSRDCADKPELVERFFAEAKAVNVIRHENIVNVLDLERLPDGRPYIIMEYLDGAPLSSHLAGRRPLPIGPSLRLMIEVLSALAAAHKNSVIHRDLKPDNIFVTPQGRAKVLDFGIAKLVPDMAGGNSPTRTGSLLGTPHYMSPEQALARPADARSDLYAVGVILFECVTGQLPFNADSLFELLRLHIHELPPRPQALRPDIAPALESAILRALAKNPAERFYSADEFVFALSDIAAQLPDSEWAPLGDAPKLSTALQVPRSSQGQSRGSQGPHQPALEHAPTYGGPAHQQANLPTPSVQRLHDQPLQPPGPQHVGQTTEPDQPAPASRLPLLVGAALLLAAGIGGGVLAATSGGQGRNREPSTESQAVIARPDVPQTAEAVSAEDREAARVELARVIAEEGAPAEEQRIDDVYVNRQQENRFSFRGIDTKKLDLSEFIDTATKLARLIIDDAVLIRFDVQGVESTGTANLTLNDGDSALLRFISPSRAKRPEGLRPGQKYEATCLIYVLIGADEATVYLLEGWECDDPPVQVPDCSLADIWQQAIDKGAPANGLASMWYAADKRGHGRFSFEIPGTSQHHWFYCN